MAHDGSADDSTDTTEADLELPSLGFGRKRKRRRAKAPAAPETTEPQDEAAPETRDEPQPEPEPAPEARADEPTEVMEPVPSRPLYADEAPTEVAPAATGPAAEPVAAPATHPDPEPAPEPARRAPRQPRLPSIGGMPAALLTGLVVGAAVVGMTAAGFRACEAIQGTSSCGNPGFFLLIAFLIVAVYLGRMLLSLFGVADPGSTSFLAVGLLAVLALLFLVEVLFAWWMIIAIPLVTMGTYALSHWVTTAFVDADA